MATDTLPRLVYVPCPGLDVARKLARALVEARLAACVNIVPGIVSVYRWKDAVEEDEEVLLLAKTTETRAAAAVALLDRLHPYEVPAITVLDATGASAGTLAWLAAETGPGG